MTKEEFGEGLMFYRACCGKEPELAHVEVWWEMLQYMPIDHFVGAVKLFISNEESPARLNFVASVKKYCGLHLKEVRHEKYLERVAEEKELDRIYRQNVVQEYHKKAIDKIVSSITKEEI